MLTQRVAPILLLIIQSTLAVDTSGLPTCGKTCVTNAINAQSFCAPTDTSCLCADSSLGYAIGYCLGSICDSVDLNTSLEWIDKFCQDSSSGGTATTATAGLFTAVSIDATATASAASKPSSSSTFTTASDSSQNGSGGLSTGAKIGIGVGVPVGVLAIAGGVLAAYCFGRRRRNTPAAKEAYVEQQGAIEASHQPPTSFTAGPVTAEKVGYETAVTEINSPLPPATPHAQPVIPVPVQVNEKLSAQPAGQQGYSPQPAVPAVPAVSPVSPYQDAASPLTYAPPQPQPNVYEMPTSVVPQQSTVTQPQSSPVYEASTPAPQYAAPDISTTGSPPPTNTAYEVPTNAPGVTGSSELPAGQS